MNLLVLAQNRSGCGYDGGDCCECECEDSDIECGAFGYNCVDPSAACYGGKLDCTVHDCRGDSYAAFLVAAPTPHIDDRLDDLILRPTNFT